MEEITVEKIKKRIKENLEKAREQNLATNAHKTRWESEADLIIVTNQSVKEKIIALGLKYKRLINKIPILNTTARKFYHSLANNPTQDTAFTTKNVKKLFGRIPFLGYLIWWIYMIVKAPIKISQLFADANELKSKDNDLESKISQLFADANELKSKDNDLVLSDILITEGYITEPAHKMQDKDDEDTFYFLLEKLFRGSMEDIKRRQNIYLSYVSEAHANSKGAFFLDIGCGRGEFLILLKEHDIPAKGLDINKLNIDLAKELGADAVLSDGLEYLNSLEDNSLVGLSMFQVIEHLDFKYMDNILKTAFKKITPNGILILESVNPYCPIALGSFYLDPTHIRPYAPDFIKVMLEWYGFKGVKIIYSSPIPKHLYFKESLMNYQAYAVVGRKRL